MKFFMLLFVMMIASCGMQGDLYLPPDEADDTQANGPDNGQSETTATPTDIPSSKADK